MSTADPFLRKAGQSEAVEVKKGVDLTVILRFFKQPKMLLMISVLIYSGFRYNTL
jgi:hypothetical protein